MLLWYVWKNWPEKACSVSVEHEMELQGGGDEIGRWEVFYAMQSNEEFSF